MNKLDQLPPAVVDMIAVVRNPKEQRSYRENVAMRLELIAEVCAAEVVRLRSESEKKTGRRKG